MLDGGLILNTLLFLAMGLVLGAIGGLFGIGGGMIAIPVLGIFFGLGQVLAQGTALVMVVPTVLAGLRAYFRSGNLDRRAAVMLAIAAIPVAVAGSLIAVHANGALLRLGFAVFLATIGLYTGVRAALGKIASIGRPFARDTIWVVGLVAGILNGLFAVGGAVFSVPVTTLLYGYTQVQAQGLSLALVAPTLVVSLVTYAHAGQVDWRIGVPLAIGAVTSVAPGVRIAQRLPERQLRLLFAVLLLVAGLALIFKR